MNCVFNKFISHGRSWPPPPKGLAAEVRFATEAVWWHETMPWTLTSGHSRIMCQALRGELVVFNELRTML